MSVLLLIVPAGVLIISVFIVPWLLVSADTCTALLRQLVRKSGRRTFHSEGIVSAEPDLAERAKQIVREELDRDTAE